MCETFLPGVSGQAKVFFARVGGLLFGLSANDGIDGDRMEGSVSFENAAPSDDVVPARAKCLLFRIWFMLNRLRRRQTHGKTIP
jgi:hypothetical protein